MPTPVINVTKKVSIELNKDNVADMISSLDFQHKDIIYKIVILESAHLKSYLATTQNNLTAMRCVKKRNHLQSNCSNAEYGYYDDWRDCITDMLLWEQAVTHNKKLSKEQYYQMLSRVYNKGVNYVKTLKKIRSYDFTKPIT